MGTSWPATFCIVVRSRPNPSVMHILIIHISKHAVGYCLHHPAEQQGSLRFLSRVEEVLGWRTAWIKNLLERQWTELAEVDPLNR